MKETSAQEQLDQLREQIIQAAVCVTLGNHFFYASEYYGKLLGPAGMAEVKARADAELDRMA